MEVTKLPTSDKDQKKSNNKEGRAIVHFHLRSGEQQQKIRGRVCQSLDTLGTKVRS